MDRSLYMISIALLVLVIFLVVVGILFLIQVSMISKRLKYLSEVLGHEFDPIVKSLGRLLEDGQDISETAKYQLRRTDQTFEYVNRGLVNITDVLVSSVSALNQKVLPAINTTYATAYGIYRGLGYFLKSKSKLEN